MINHNDLFDLISKALKRVDDRLFLLQTRHGDFSYPIYNNTTGLPTIRERFWVLLRGSGRPDQFDKGGPLPDEHLEVWAGDWGIAPVAIAYEVEPDAIVQQALNAGRDLVIAVQEQRVPA